MAVGAPLNRQWDKVRAKEWRESLFLRYSIDPPDLMSNCNGCGAAFKICHTLDCKKGGLIMACHNKLRDGVANLVDKAFTPAHVRDDPKIFTGRNMQEGKGEGKVIAAAKGKEAPLPEERE